MIYLTIFLYLTGYLNSWDTIAANARDRGHKLDTIDSILTMLWPLFITFAFLSHLYDKCFPLKNDE